MQLEETSTMDSLIRTKMLKSKVILWLSNRLDSSSLLLSNASISPLICSHKVGSFGQLWSKTCSEKNPNLPSFSFVLVTLLKKESTLSRSWPKGGTTFQLWRLLNISSNFKYKADAVLNVSSFLVEKPSNLASTCNYIRC